MTVTDFTLMAVLVIVITFGLIRASGVKGYFERGIFTLGGVVDPVGSYNPTRTVLNAYFTGTRYPYLDVELLEMEKTRILKLMEDGEIAEASSRLKMHLIGLDTYPGLLKYLSQAADLAPLLDFWEELRTIRGGLL